MCVVLPASFCRQLTLIQTSAHLFFFGVCRQMAASTSSFPAICCFRQGQTVHSPHPHTHLHIQSNLTVGGIDIWHELIYLFIYLFFSSQEPYLLRSADKCFRVVENFLLGLPVPLIPPFDAFLFGCVSVAVIARSHLFFTCF